MSEGRTTRGLLYTIVRQTATNSLTENSQCTLVPHFFTSLLNTYPKQVYTYQMKWSHIHKVSALFLTFLLVSAVYWWRLVDRLTWVEALLDVGLEVMEHLLSHLHFLLRRLKVR